MEKQKISSHELDDVLKQAKAHGVGALLKATRLRIGDSVRKISDVLRIRRVYLEAIEDGRFDDLPGPTYATGFIRVYAEYLGLDSEEVVRRYKADISDNGAASERSLVFPEPIPEPGIPGGAVVFVGIVVAVVAYGVWYVNTTKDGFLAELISPVPERLADAAAKDKGSNEKNAAEKTVEAAPEPASETAQLDEAVKEPEKAAPAPTPEPESQPETAAAQPVPETPAEIPAAEPAEPVAEIYPPETSGVSVPEPAPEPAQIPEKTPEKISEKTPENTPEPTPEPIQEAVAQPLPAPHSDPQPAPHPEPKPVPQVAAKTPAPKTPAPKTPAPKTPAPEIVTTAAPAPETASLPAVESGAAEATGKVTIHALTNSWIQIRDDIAGELVLTRLLRAGDLYEVPDRKGLKLSTGNAGALEILVDGKIVPAIGRAGDVKRNVALDAGKLKAGTAVGN